MKTFQVVVLVVACILCTPPAFALVPLFMNFRSNVMKGTVINDSGMFQSAVPQLQSVISPLLKRAGGCNAGFFLCGDNCIGNADTCCIDTRSNTPSGFCTFSNAQCCLNTGTNDAFCCQPGWKCTFGPDGCSSSVVDTITIVTVTPPTPGPVTVTADPPPAPTTTVPGPPAQTITVTPPQVVLTVTQSPRTVTVTQSLGGTTVTLTSGTLTVVATT